VHQKFISGDARARLRGVTSLLINLDGPALRFREIAVNTLQLRLGLE